VFVLMVRLCAGPGTIDVQTLRFRWGWTIRGYLNQSYRGIVSAVVAEFLLVRETLIRWMQADKIPVRLEGNRQII
jgi:hypothetical protein